MSCVDRTALIEALRTYDAALRENGATGLFIFGSRAGTARPDSDLDLFIDYDPAVKVPRMFGLMQIEEEIAQALGMPVTITTRNALHRSMRASIERDAIRAGSEEGRSSARAYTRSRIDRPRLRSIR
jgi:predicted nucleotidyltransferase